MTEATADLMPQRTLDGFVPPAVKTPGVTVVIPNWNHRTFLPRAIRSARQALALLKKKGVAGEIIVIDDGSRDGSVGLLADLVGAYGWDDIHTVFLANNAGLAAARNLGIACSRYRHILFLDADNELLAEGVFMLYRAATSTGAALTYGNLLDRSAGIAQSMRSNAPPTLQLLSDNYIDALALVDALRAAAVGGYVRDVKLQYWADWEFVLRLIAEAALIVFVPTVVGIYNILPLSMLAESSGEQTRDRKQMRRIFAQLGPREWDTRQVGRVFHPDTGFLDDGWQT